MGGRTRRKSEFEPASSELVVVNMCGRKKSMQQVPHVVGDPLELTVVDLSTNELECWA